MPRKIRRFFIKAPPVSFRYKDMNFETLDQITMWMAFIYGMVLFFVLEFPPLKKVETKAPQMFLILRQHQPIALVCFWVGGLWILQEIWIKV